MCSYTTLCIAVLTRKYPQARSPHTFWIHKRADGEVVIHYKELTTHSVWCLPLTRKQHRSSTTLRASGCLTTHPQTPWLHRPPMCLCGPSRLGSDRQVQHNHTRALRNSTIKKLRRGIFDFGLRNQRFREVSQHFPLENASGFLSFQLGGAKKLRRGSRLQLS